MGISVKDFVTGRKTFFLTPDTSLVPKQYLEDFFALGYECYYIEYTRNFNIEETVERIHSTFADSILVFNIDYRIEGLDWADYIRELKAKYGNDICIAVTYVKKMNKDAKAFYEKLFLFDIGIRGGCIQLEYKKNENFSIIQHLLYANQAQGRRKNIRALCNKHYTFSFMLDDVTYSGVLQDISLSHFSFIMPEGKLEIPNFQKIKEVTFYLNGLIIKSSAIEIMKRDTINGTLFVFGFLDETGANQVNDRYRSFLIPNLYTLMNENFSNLMKEISASNEEGKFQEEIKK